VVPRLRLPLFTGGWEGYDFEENEDIYPDGRPDRYDGGNSDMDGIDEGLLSQLDELASEFVYYGWYEDASWIGGNRIPILRHVFYYEYRGEPGAIKQFHGDAELIDGSPLIREGSRVLDISPTLPGRQVPADEDLSLANLEYGVRIRYSLGYRTLMWLEGGEWRSVGLEECDSLRGVAFLGDRLLNLVGRRLGGRFIVGSSGSS